ncbi:hypothetical protein [Endozoicomonas atrinae]|uniref:hypothetical protein n=1 Tax=Endozoicomonas atrinae TaxID=1333660 RepID=UPI0008240DBE|nr:hypothetical protein [Endozoicomonas atrinae]
MKNNYFGLLVALLAIVWLQGCSWQNAEAPAEKPPIRFEVSWYQPDLPAKALGLSEQSKTLVGQCEFQPELLERLSGQSRGLLLPLLSIGEHGQLFLDPLVSKPLYQALEPEWSLGSPYDSLQLYQRWVSSVEHSCPEGLRRELAYCDMKPFSSLGGLLDSSSHYDLERLNNWLAKQSLDYVILPDLALLKSDAALLLSYSSESPAITEQSSEVGLQHILPFKLRQTLDWVLLNKESRLISDQFVSYGHCTVSWHELDEAVSLNKMGVVDVELLNKIDILINKGMVYLIRNLSL